MVLDSGLLATFHQITGPLSLIFSPLSSADRKEAGSPASREMSWRVFLPQSLNKKVKEKVFLLQSLTEKVK